MVYLHCAWLVVKKERKETSLISMIERIRQERRMLAAQCYRAFKARTGLMSCEGCEIENFCPSRVENWDGEKIEKEALEDVEEKSVTVKTLCNLLIFLRERWIFVPMDHSIKVKAYWRNCGKRSIRSELFVRIVSGHSKGALVSRKLLRPPGMW